MFLGLSNMKTRKRKIRRPLSAKTLNAVLSLLETWVRLKTPLVMAISCGPLRFDVIGHLDNKDPDSDRSTALFDFASPSGEISACFIPHLQKALQLDRTGEPVVIMPWGGSRLTLRAAVGPVVQRFDPTVIH